ncbi:hypothetical protein [Chelativorans sp. YIM 93263]|uniref:hypothetical protein n=1 Tax=Chelativorans sp. YIM 93263 TaxID=2906648 RepID=UPI002379C4C1|nr:hypothetical protein [Chelativorans sp. YIM 93263]
MSGENMRFVFRLFAICLLLLAVTLAVFDATRVIAAGEWVFTPVGETWNEYGPEVSTFVQSLAENEEIRWLWDMAVEAVLSLPGWLVFAVLAIAFYALGRRRTDTSRFA